jgi:hypothetical protein
MIGLSTHLMRTRSQGSVRDDEAIDEERPQYVRCFIGFFLQNCGPQTVCYDASIQVQDWVAGSDRFDEIEGFAHDLRHDQLKLSMCRNYVGNRMKMVLLVHIYLMSPQHLWGLVICL